MRNVEEWRGSKPSTPVPPRVRIRVFGRYHGACQGCLRKIYPGDIWDCDHIIALVNGGKNEESNLRPLCSWCHKMKTRQDIGIKSKTAKMRAKHLGLKKRRKIRSWRRFNGSPVYAED